MDDSYIGDSYQLYGEILSTRSGTFDACFGSHVNKEADTSEMDADHVLTRPYILFYVKTNTAMPAAFVEIKFDYKAKFGTSQQDSVRVKTVDSSLFPPQKADEERRQSLGFREHMLSEDPLNTGDLLKFETKSKCGTTYDLEEYSKLGSEGVERGRQTYIDMLHTLRYYPSKRGRRFVFVKGFGMNCELPAAGSFDMAFLRKVRLVDGRVTQRVSIRSRDGRGLV